MVNLFSNKVVAVVYLAVDVILFAVLTATGSLAELFWGFLFYNLPALVYLAILASLKIFHRGGQALNLYFVAFFTLCALVFVAIDINTEGLA